eukprot:scaffold67919_cov32-Tisochrysis_lutea.AAC.1
MSEQSQELLSRAQASTACESRLRCVVHAVQSCVPSSVLHRLPSRRTIVRRARRRRQDAGSA